MAFLERAQIFPAKRCEPEVGNPHENVFRPMSVPQDMLAGRKIIFSTVDGP